MCRCGWFSTKFNSEIFIYKENTMSKEMREQIDKIKNFGEFLNENNDKDITQFLSNKNYINQKSKLFLYHGTKIHPDNFSLRDDYNGEDVNMWSGDLPEGYLFLTTDIGEAKSYGQYIIPCELERYDNLHFNVYNDNPSRTFDMDFGSDLYIPKNYVGFWEKFEESGKSVLIIKGSNNKWTVITDFGNVIPRTDLSKEYYNDTM